VTDDPQAADSSPHRLDRAGTTFVDIVGTLVGELDVVAC